MSDSIKDEIKEIEYLDDFCDEDAGGLQFSSNNLLTTHTLVLRSAEDNEHGDPAAGEGGSNNEYFFCLQCQKRYGTIQQFAFDHQPDEESNSVNEEINYQHQVETQQNLDDSRPMEAEVYEDDFIENDCDANFNDLIKKEAYFEADEDSLSLQVEENVIPIGQDDIQVDDAVLTSKEEYSDLSADALDATQTEREREIDRYYCYECGSVFSDLKIAEAHQCPSPQSDSNKAPNQESQITLDRDIVTCEFDGSQCSSTFSSRQSVSLHEKVVSPPPAEALFSCDVCNIEFSTSKGLKLHEKMHKERGSLRSIQEALPEGAELELKTRKFFYCQICKKNFDHNLLRIHRNMHLNKKEHICGICNKKFDNQASFDLHQQLHANMAANRAQWKTEAPSGSGGSGEQGTTTTGNAPAKLKSRSKHVANAKRLYLCQYCGHEFSRPHEKVIHERVHTGEKPHACEVCGKRFRTSYSLTLHLRTHTGIRPYVCATCNKRFKSHPAYVHHLRIHQSEKLYKCDVCEKAFRTSVQLSGHKKCHTKPFSCTICNRAFAHLYSVTNHMKSHDRASSNGSDLRHVCAYCGASYVRSFSLRCHLAREHPTDSSESLTAPILKPDVEEIIVSEENCIIEQSVTGCNSDNDAIYVDDDDTAMQLITAAAEAAAASSSTATEPNGSSSKRTNTRRRTLVQAKNEAMLSEIITGWLDK